MPKVFANGRSIVHAGDGLKHTAAPPDVCKTPSPGGPIPVPYVNVASNSDLAKGTTTIHIEGNSVALASSNLSTSMGDEPGTAGGGLVSSKTQGKLTWGSSSIDVKFEGKGVVRFVDVTQHNGNSFNTAFMSTGVMAINPRCAAGAPAAIATMTKQWHDTMTKFEEEANGYANRPGTCAGAKLIGKSRHVADSMTEIYFSFTGGKRALTFNMIYRGPIHFAPVDGPWTPPSADDLASGKGGPPVEKRGDMRRKKEITVPSCQSCQDTLFMARCDIEKQSCG